MHRAEGEGRARRVFRALLFVYPEAFRARHGAAMTATFIDAWRNRRRGRGAASLFWARAVADVMTEGLAERVAARRRPVSGPSPGASRGGMRWLRELVQDARGGVRALQKDPAFTVVAVFTLALGIGAPTAVFSVISHVLLRELPFGDPDALVFVEWRTGTGGLSPSGADVAQMRESLSTLERVAFISELGEASLIGSEDPEDVAYARVTADFFDVLQVEPAAGRTFTDDEGLLPAEGDDAVSAPAPVVISHSLWLRRFGGGAVLGASMHINGRPSTIIGVLPEAFRAPVRLESRLGAEPEVWLPMRVALSGLARTDRLRDQDTDDTGVAIGRLAAGIDVERARAELDRLAPLLGLPLDARASVMRVADSLNRTSRPILLALFGAVALVLVMACSNVAGLLITRGAGRRHEMVVRQAIGASRARVIRQVLTESAVLAIAGALLGVLLAHTAGSLLFRVTTSTFSNDGQPVLDLRVLTFTIGVTVVATFLSGTLPALMAARTTAAQVLRSDRGVAGGRSAHTLRTALTVSQIALVVVLLGAAGLVLQSVRQLERAHPGFVAEDAVSFDLALVYADRYRGPAERAAFLAALEERLLHLPGVTSAGATGGLPLSGRDFVQPYAVGRDLPDSDNPLRANFRVITPGYLPAIGTRIVLGRNFTPADDRQDRRVVIVDEALARRLARDGQVVSRVITLPLDGQWERAQVIGVAEQVKFDDLRTVGRETVYVPYRHEASRRLSVVVRGRTPHAELAGALREELRAMDPRLMPHNVQRLTGYVAAQVVPVRDASMLLSLFGLAALLLSAVGLYGTVSAGVAQQHREIGIRMALGAQPSSVITSLLRTGLAWAAIGIAAGTGLMLLAGRMLRALLYDIAPHDPATLAASAAIVTVAVLAAIVIPARRAAHVDPCISLHGD